VTERIRSLCEAVEKNENCAARHCYSVPVNERFQGETVWEGIVEVFELTNHPRAARCYAWRYQDGDETRYITILDVPPIVSAETAVRAAIASGAQK
jgi:hypothetical protein